jgi:hypothetical protein
MADEIVVDVPAPDTNIPEPPDPTLAPAPEVVVPPAPAPLPELRYEYQPTDEKGNALGGKQVIVYRTNDELAEKLRDQNIQLVRKLREVTRKQRLGLTDNDVPADLERLPEVQIAKQPLTVEERYQLSQDLNDPEKFEAARDKLISSSGLTQAIEQQQMTINQMLARTNAQIFIERTPTFYLCEDNLQTLTDWMVKNKLQPTVKNFEVAYSVVQEAGLLVAPPIVREEAPAAAVVPVAPAQPAQPAVVENTVPNSQAPVVPDTRISEPSQPQTKRQSHVPSGLNSRLASNTGPAPAAKTLTLADIDRMSSDEYGRRIKTDPEFVKLVNELESKRPPRPRRA